MQYDAVCHDTNLDLQAAFSTRMPHWFDWVAADQDSRTDTNAFPQPYHYFLIY